MKKKNDPHIKRKSLSKNILNGVIKMNKRKILPKLEER